MKSGDDSVAIEIGEGLLEGSAERLARVAVVMEVDLDLAHSGGAHLRERLDEARVVLLPREEVRVARRSPVRVAERLRELRIPRSPGLHAREAAIEWDVAVKRLVVIAEREEEMASPAHLAALSPDPPSLDLLSCAVLQPRPDPEMELLLSECSERAGEPAEIDVP
jgi:hypothetical protein